MESSMTQVIRSVVRPRVLAAVSISVVSAILALPSSFAMAAQAGPDDSEALRGVTVGKVVFDINATDPKTLAAYLQVIEQTHDDLLRQKVTPDIILAIRGFAVTFFSADRKRFDPAKQEHLEAIAEHVRRLRDKGVRLESCAIAMRWNQVDQSTLLDGIKAVGNTFVSLTAYQAKGYAVIPIY